MSPSAHRDDSLPSKSGTPASVLTSIRYANDNGSFFTKFDVLQMVPLVNVGLLHRKQ